MDFAAVVKAGPPNTAMISGMWFMARFLYYSGLSIKKHGKVLLASKK